MCGITGFIGAGSRADLDAMISALVHRGPDASASWADQDHAVFLGHRRLIVLDPEGGAQPLSTQDGRFTIVFNGEIYNHLALRKSLEGLGYRFQSDHSDTETLLLGYREWGASIQDRLNGMWAFAIYDRHKQQLFLSRDRFGQKPLYFAQYRDGFAFASELSALLCHAQVPRDQDAKAIRKYYGYGYFPGANSPFQAIRKLRAGHCLTLHVNRLRPEIRKWWEFHLDPQPLDHSEDAWCELLRDTLAGAVRRRLQSDVPLGVFLSGGVDSSTVAWFANQAGNQPVSSFALGFLEKSFDERPFAKLAADHIGTHHKETILPWQEAVQSMPGIVDRLDEPLGDGSLIPTAHLCAFTRKEVTVALSGDGADELFAGYDPYLALGKAQIYRRLIPRPVHHAIRVLAGRLPVSQANMAFTFKLNKTLEGLDQRRPFWIPVWMAPLGPKPLSELLSEPIELEDLYEEAIDAWSDEPRGDLMGQALQFFTRLYLTDSVLAKVDRASMMHSLEVRSPFLDIEVVNLVRKMPHHLKLRGSNTKYILKKAMARHLPKSLLDRRKKGFGMPIGAWFHQGYLDLPSGDSPFHHSRNFAKHLHAAHMNGRTDARLFLWNYWVHWRVQNRLAQNQIEPAAFTTPI